MARWGVEGWEWCVVWEWGEGVCLDLGWGGGGYLLLHGWSLSLTELLFPISLRPSAARLPFILLLASPA